jgi:polysaccharide biosynthesis protein PslG
MMTSSRRSGCFGKRTTRPIALALSLLILLFSSSAFFAIAQLNLVATRPVLAPAPEAIPESYFGMTLHNYNTTPWPSIPFASLRTWDTAVTWANIQPAPNTFVWSKLDALINLAERHGVDLVFTLGRTPRWASANPDAKSPYGPGQCAPPANIQYWDEFLRAVATHVGSKIKFWETWNEPQSPDSIFYCGDVSTMVELQKRLYDIVKANVPGAMVLTPSAVGGYGPAWMSRFLAGGGGEYADIMAFHGYWPSDDAETIISTISKFKAVFAERGQATKPAWDTEAGWGEDKSLPDPDLQASFLAKFYLLHWSAGIARFYWYAYDNGKWGTLWDSKNGLHQAGVAYREVHQWLVGATMTAPCTTKEGLWTCNLVRQNDHRAMVLWSAISPIQPNLMVNVPNDYRTLRDLQGRSYEITNHYVPISNSPVLVEGDFAR